MLRRKIKHKRGGGSSNFRSLVRESLTGKLILNKDLKEERKQAIQIPAASSYAKALRWDHASYDQ